MTGRAWDRFRRGVLTQTLAAAPEQLSRLSWSSDQIERAQRASLHRLLLLHAAEDSPFHRRRLSGIDLAGIDPTDLSMLPVMTKTDMMDALDDVFTDRRLRRRDVESALAATGFEPVPILDDYIALASGGCSGRRGLFVFDQAAATSYITALARPPIEDPAPPDMTPPGPQRIALVAAPSAVHATGFGAALTSIDGWPVRYELVPSAEFQSQPTGPGFADGVAQDAKPPSVGVCRRRVKTDPGAGDPVSPWLRRLPRPGF